MVLTVEPLGNPITHFNRTKGLILDLVSLVLRYLQVTIEERLKYHGILVCQAVYVLFSTIFLNKGSNPFLLILPVSKDF